MVDSSQAYDHHAENDKIQANGLKKGTHTFTPNLQETGPVYEYQPIVNLPPKILKDSGKREEFPTGAVRDSQEGKGFFTGVTLEGIRRLALVTEDGAAKYSPRNWEKGMPVERCLNSALRHVFQYLDGWDDEDHLGQAFWNLMAAVTMEERAEAGRLPKDLLLETRQKYIGHPEAG